MPLTTPYRTTPTVFMDLERVAKRVVWEWWERRPSACQFPPLYYLLYSLIAQGAVPPDWVPVLEFALEHRYTQEFRRLLRQQLGSGVAGYLWLGRHRGSQLTALTAADRLAAQVYGSFRDDEQHTGPYSRYYLSTPRVYAGALALVKRREAVYVHTFPRSWRDDAY